MKKLRIFAALITFFLMGYGQYVSKYLNEPDRLKGYVDSCAHFWMNVYDPTYGGYYSNIGRSFNTILNTEKVMISQSRNAYGLCRAFMLTGDSLYLEYAQYALKFMTENAWEKSYKGWINNFDRYGNPSNPTENKTAFNQHYALLGLVAYFEATGDSTYYKWIDSTLQVIDTHLWDSDPDFYGYYDFGYYNWRASLNKSFNATVDALTTHLISLYLITHEPGLKERIARVVENIQNHLVASMDQQAIGFVEHFDTQWNWDNSQLMTIMGHLLKTAWCLERVNYFLPDPSNTASAQKLVDHVLEKAYDHQYGGPYKDYNRQTGEMLMWGNPDTTKAWWQMEQAVMAGLTLYEQTGEQKYLNMADSTLLFSMTHFVDHEYGEMYADRTRTGGLAWNENKGSGGKAGYHSIEMAYYTWLYAHVFLYKEPFTLYYLFHPETADRTIHLEPFSYQSGALNILQVTKDGLPYSNFDANLCDVYVPAGVKGLFAVTFNPNPVEIAEKLPLARSIRLEQNFPNPFNPSTRIRYNLSQPAEVIIEIFNGRGQKISTPEKGFRTHGSHEIVWNGEGFPSGIYFYRLRAGNYVQTRQMLLIK